MYRIFALLFVYLSFFQFFALITRPYAQENSPSSSPIAPKYFRYQMQSEPNETFVVKMTDPNDIEKAYQDLNNGRKYIVGGTVRSGDGGFNLRHFDYWSWYLDPETIELAGAWIEICDARPTYVETHFDEWVNKTYCPWSGQIIEELATTPSPVVPTVIDMRTLLTNYLLNDDWLYRPLEYKINLLDFAWLQRLAH